MCRDVVEVAVAAEAVVASMVAVVVATVETVLVMVVAFLLLADWSAMSDLHTREGEFRDLRVLRSEILGGAFIVLMIGAIIMRAAATCCLK